jgi:hypothetical protein
MKDKYKGWSGSFYEGNSDRPIIIKDGDKDRLVAMFRNIEDRDRVLACIDALNGVSNEALSSGVVGEMVELLRLIGTHVDRPFGGMFTNTEEDALKSILAKLEGNDG